MEKISKIISAYLPLGPMDSIGVGYIDFKSQSFKVLEASCIDGEILLNDKGRIYFDLASLTKPLTNSLSYFLMPEKFDEKILLCLNHRGGLPAWGLLPQAGWKEQILSYPIQESSTLYSDFSSLRVMLELEKKELDIKKLCQKIWHQETLYWLDLSSKSPTVQTGLKNSRPNFGQVHDPNAWNLHSFCTHAGLFSTTHGLCQTLLNYQTQTGFLNIIHADLKTHQHRFSFGWDRAEDTETSLAGQGCSEGSFGHLGFTGTSIWIDPVRMKGHVILSNATKLHWYDKNNLNYIRRKIGKLVWMGDI